MYGRKSGQVGHIALWALLGLVVSLSPFIANGKDAAAADKMPDRMIEMAAEHPGVIVPPDEDVSIDIIFHNKGRSDETVKVWISQIPQGWKASIKTYRYAVTGLHVMSDDDKTLTFEAEPEKGVKPGDYKFHIKAETPDGKFRMSQDILIQVKPKDKTEKKIKVSN